MDDKVLADIFDGARRCECGHMRDSHFYKDSVCQVDSCDCNEFLDGEEQGE